MKLNLIIDGNYLLNKDVYILLSEKTIYSDLPTLLRKDMEKMSKMYNFDNIYFVSDSKKRWRLKIYDQYKKNRKPNKNIDWEEVYGIYNDFKDFLKSKSNIHFYEIDWAEGDDLISYIVQESNKKGISNVIVASDNDIHQLVKFDIGLKYINMVYNYKFSDEKTFLPENYNIFMQEVIYKSKPTLFDMNSDIEISDFIDYLISKTKIYQINNEELLFNKLIIGDKKDNIPSIYLKKGKNNNYRGIGKKGGMSIYKLYKEINNEVIDFYSNDFIDKSVDIVSFTKKINNTEIINQNKSKLKLNRELIILDEKYVPIPLMNVIKKNIKIY